MRASLREDAGFTSVNFMLMALVLVVAIGAISAELWHLVAEHREVAGLTDGAAIAGASAVNVDALRADPPSVVLDPGHAQARACAYLQANGGVAACPGAEAVIVVTADTVTVSMRRGVDLTLMRIFSGLDPSADTSPIEVAASSTAGVATR